MEKIRIEVDKVILYYMDRADPYGNPYRFYVYKGMASEIEYFCTEEAGNMTIPIGEGKYIEIMPKWVDEERQEIDAKGLDCLGYVRELRVDDYLSPTTLGEIAEEIKKKVNRG
jgi:hypothetical protein